ncbi:hypothetical protein [Cellvibrio sp. pealriver]|uniref:hypothetical protein n=1 Tax=Cellvibrio sp. pealriver TaxID=1622269 RepID=UPI00066FD63D|nr:hypothetical protein [Cellvibrio sp. pealriver]
MIDNLLIGILGALIGVFFGHRLTLTLYRERGKSLERAYYNEFEIMLNDFKSWFPTLVGEYDEPLREAYSGRPSLDLKLIQGLVLELVSTDKVINSDQRKLLANLERVIENIRRNDVERDIYIKQWLKDGEAFDKIERRRISQKLSFITANLLLDVSQSIYYLNKLIFERSKFSFGKDVSVISFFCHSCEVCKMDFVDDKWSNLTRRLNVE